jgi:GntR family transcriptional regulator, transcriptional repressor for pyruvate dehydrogenase complex
MKLPSERVLAAEFRVGRPAIREAIKALSILDVLASRRGDGTYVRSLEALATSWPKAIHVTGQNFNMLELLEIRKMVEPKAAALAAARASEQDLRAIMRYRSSLEDESIQWRAVADLDYELHTAIVKAAGNSLLQILYEFLKPYLLRSREITARTTPNWDRMRKDHSAIVEAIVRGESQAAEEATLEHMRNIGLDLISSRIR